MGIGDAGAACLLHALALDPRITSLNLRGCGLRGGSGQSIAVFIEMHNKIEEINLSHNSLSFEFGELLVEALRNRKYKMVQDKPKGQIGGAVRLQEYHRRLTQRTAA